LSHVGYVPDDLELIREENLLLLRFVRCRGIALDLGGLKAGLRADSKVSLEAGLKAGL